MPEVSIAIPAYNGAAYLKECLRSAVHQTFTDTEIVVVDDCSTDRTRAIAEQFSRRDPRVRVYRNSSRMGLVPNWNRSIQYCTGNWIKFLFQDDLLDIRCIEQMLDAAAVNKGETPSRFVVCDRRFIIEKGVAAALRDFYAHRVTPISRIFPGKDRISGPEFSKGILEQGVGENFVGEPSSVMIRRDICFEYSCFNPHLIHLCDLEYWTRIGTNEGMAYIPRPLNRFRVHAESASARNHNSRGLETTYLDRLVLLHDYFFHPVYRNLRKAPGTESALEERLRDNLNQAVGRFKRPSDTGYAPPFQTFLERYPILRRYLPE